MFGERKRNDDCETRQEPIVVPWTFTNASRRALEAAQDLVDDAGQVYVVHIAVFPPQSEIPDRSECRVQQQYQECEVGFGATRRPLSKDSNDSKSPKNVQNWLGTAMLSQAGAAIALSAVAVSRNEAAFEPVQTIILGSVLFFEILGPILIRTSVVKSSEVPKAHVNRHHSGSILDEVRMMLAKFRKSTGVAPMTRDEFDGLTVSTLSRPTVEGIPQDATLDAIISYVEDSPDNTFAVTDNDNQVVGIIRYPILSECLFDPSISCLLYTSPSPRDKRQSRMPSSA